MKARTERRAKMAPIQSLADGNKEKVKNREPVAMEGFAHPSPFEAGHGVIRQGLSDLTPVRMTPDLICDPLTGMGCAPEPVFS